MKAKRNSMREEAFLVKLRLASISLQINLAIVLLLLENAWKAPVKKHLPFTLHAN